MARQNINIGIAANDKTGDPLRTAFTKTNANFTELYTNVASITNDISIPINYADVLNAPTDISDLTDTSGLLIPDPPSSLANNNRQVSLDTAGTLTVPYFTDNAFQLVLSTSNYIPSEIKPELQLISEPWSFNVSIVYTSSGQAELVIVSSSLPSADNPGYSTGDAFSFNTDVHGIPNYTLTITLSDVTHVGFVVWTATLTPSSLPAYPATIKSPGHIKITANTSNWTFGADGNLTLPKDLKFNDGASSILARDPTTSGGIGGLSINGKSRTYITIGDDSYGYMWDFRPFGLNDFDSTVKPAIMFPGGGWLQEDLTDFDNISMQLGSQGSLTLTTKSNDMMNPTDYNWVFGTDGRLTLPADGDIVDSTGTSVLGQGNGLGTITVPAVADTTYKGLKASYGRVYSNSNANELNVSKIVIHKPADITTTIDLSTNNDDFRVAGLTTSDVVAMFVLYGDVNGPKDVTVLQAFTEAVIDTVLLAGGVAGSFNTLADMRAAFNTNIAALSSAAGGLYTQFKFYEPFANATTGVTTVLQGSGAVFEIGDNGLGEYTASGIQSNGINYLPGHKILVLGTDLGGVTPDNDCIITVDSISDGGLIFQWSVVGAAPGTVSALYAPVTGTNYQVGIGAAFQGIGKNDNGTLYANFNSQGSNYVAGDVLTLLGSDLQAGVSPDNDITLTVTSSDAGDGRIYGLTITGTFPTIWPTNFIVDGGADQYDDGNYISTNLTNQINYNGGEIVTDGVGEFGTGSAYSFVYQPGIFGLLVTGNSANYVETSGGSGADGTSVADTGELYTRAIPEQTFDNAINYINIVSNDPMDGIRFSDGTRLTSAEGVGRVKLTSPDDRRIEETSGYKSVSVTARTTTNLTATASRSAVNESGIWLGFSEPLHDIVVSPQLYGIIDYDSMQFSIDNNTWYNFSTISVIDNERVYGIPVPVSYNQGDPIYFRYNSGGAPVVWWDKNELPVGGQNFRGAVIDYHAWTGESTIIGTIHIVDDSNEEHISHQEVQSGSTDGENDDLWLVQNEGTISYRRIDGESKTLKVHWTAKVFYGSEFWD